MSVADVGTGVEEAIVTFEGIAITTPSVAKILQNDDDDAVDPHLEHIKNEAGVDESDDEDGRGSPTDDSGEEESDASESGDKKEISHFGSLSSTFPIENQNNLMTMRTLKNHLDKTKSLKFMNCIVDFHLLLFLTMSYGLGSNVLALAACVSTEIAVPEGYQLLIESMANKS
ncbi:hypothetical protein GOBAR_AA31028 [Gossypium barbadense]|uniref:Uncharacterized protein n=1 Tax=Gossypium barbadense TaxID=3634 RepID=A0A2P5WEZ6_GOSBA|nr:hypothetical protein GOBAR_AA31028 [Gossypium barbadense]